MTLIQYLIKKGILTKEKAVSLELRVKSSAEKIEEAILEERVIPESTLFSLKSENLNIPLKKEVDSERVSTELLKLIPEESAKHYQMVAIGKKEGKVEVGMVYPEDLKAKEALEFLARRSKFSYRIFLITSTNFKQLLKRYITLRREVTKVLAKLKKEPGGAPSKERVAEIRRLVEEAPITKIVTSLLRHAVEGGASDIHIEPAFGRLRIRFRLLGILYPSIFLPLNLRSAIVARIKILSKLRLDETRIPQDGRFSSRIGGKDIDFRVSTFPVSEGEKVAIRILDPTTGLKEFDQLGLSGRDYRVVKEAMARPYGLILNTGPTGCGKTTTLYAILRILNREEINIVTLEDPIEYYIDGINQSQVRPDIGYDFANGLRHTLRQDPDIIMVGEVRDKETAALLTQAALIGDLVLSTLHTSNVLGAIPRLIDLGVDPFLIPPTLGVVLAQRLIRTLCPLCKKRVKASPEVAAMISREVESLPPIVKKEAKLSSPLYIYQAQGCKKCNSGYSDRIGIFEVLSMTRQLEEIILKNPTQSEIEKEARRQGRISMRQDGILKVLKGITTIEEVIRVAGESKNLPR